MLGVKWQDNSLKMCYVANNQIVVKIRMLPMFEPTVPLAYSEGLLASAFVILFLIYVFSIQSE